MRRLLLSLSQKGVQQVRNGAASLPHYMSPTTDRPLLSERRLKKMKFNFRKVASVLASAVMLGSTAGFALAANYPSPFVVNGVPSAAIVTGSNAPLDSAAATSIQSDLNSKVTTTSGGVPGDAKAVETGSQKLYVGDYMNTTKAIFTSDQLPTILKGGEVTEEDSGSTRSYELKISVPNAKIIYDKDTPSLSAPVLYADFNNGETYTLKIVFPTAVNMTQLTDEKINLFGKEYVISGSTSDLSTTKLTMFEQATPVTVADGQSVTVAGHTISVAVEDADTASISVDGVSESKNEGWSGKINGVDIYLKDVIGPNVQTTTRGATIYVNSQKVVLENGQEVVFGSEDLDGTSVSFTSNGGKVSEIDITVTPRDLDNEVKYIKEGDSFTDPVFGTLKFYFEKATPELDDTAARDYILLKPSGEKTVELKFTNKAGKTYDLDILKPSSIMLNSTYGVTNGTDPGTWRYNATTLGVGDYNLTVTNSGNILENNYFITCAGEYTQIWRLKDIDVNDAKVKVEDQGSSSSSVEISLGSSNTGSTGSLTLADGSSATIALTNNGTSPTINVSAACDYLYTKKGAKIDLSKANAPTSNLSTINITEETNYNGGLFMDNNGTTLGKSIALRFTYDKDGRSGKDMELKTITPAGTSGTDYWTDSVGDYDNYYVTKYGTFIKQTGDTDKTVEIYYPEDAMSLSFYIGEIKPAASASSVQIIKDTDAIPTDKNLIVVGGSCVNSLAAKIMGVSYPSCGESQNVIAKDKYIIKVVAASSVVSGAADGKIAVLVAGWEAADTAKAANKLLEGVSTDVNSPMIVGPATGA